MAPCWLRKSSKIPKKCPFQDPCKNRSIFASIFGPTWGPGWGHVGHQQRSKTAQEAFKAPSGPLPEGLFGAFKIQEASRGLWEPSWGHFLEAKNEAFWSHFEASIWKEFLRNFTGFSNEFQGKFIRKSLEMRYSNLCESLQMDPR